MNYETSLTYLLYVKLNLNLFISVIVFKIEILLDFFQFIIEYLYLLKKY